MFRRRVLGRKAAGMQASSYSQADYRDNARLNAGELDVLWLMIAISGD